MEDMYLNPPDYDEPEEVDAYDVEEEVDIDAIIIVDANGDYEYEDTNYTWAESGDSRDGDWYDEENGVYLTDVSGMVENIDELICELVPNAPGRYHITGLATIHYRISGICQYSDYLGKDEDGYPEFDVTIDTDNAESDHLSDLDTLSNFDCEPVDDLATL